MTPIYRVKNLIKIIPGADYSVAIRSLTVHRGDKVAITGPSGCGKSTALDMLGLSLKPDEAEVFDFAAKEREYDIRELWRAGDLDKLADLRRQCLGYVLQSGELLPFLSVGENMRLTARLAGISAAEAEARARDLALRLGLSEKLGAQPSTLSVGQRQRAAIIRALCADPPVILADEPTAALDPESAAAVMGALLDSVDRVGASLILVTHNEAWAATGGLRRLPFNIVSSDGKTAAQLSDGSAP